MPIRSVESRAAAVYEYTWEELSHRPHALAAAVDCYIQVFDHEAVFRDKDHHTQEQVYDLLESQLSGNSENGARLWLSMMPWNPGTHTEAKGYIKVHEDGLDHAVTGFFWNTGIVSREKVLDQVRSTATLFQECEKQAEIIENLAITLGMWPESRFEHVLNIPELGRREEWNMRGLTAGLLLTAMAKFVTNFDRAWEYVAWTDSDSPLYYLALNKLSGEVVKVLASYPEKGNVERVLLRGDIQKARGSMMERAEHLGVNI